MSAAVSPFHTYGNARKLKASEMSAMSQSQADMDASHPAELDAEERINYPKEISTRFHRQVWQTIQNIRTTLQDPAADLSLSGSRSVAFEMHSTVNGHSSPSFLLHSLLLQEVLVSPYIVDILLVPAPHTARAG